MKKEHHPIHILHNMHITQYTCHKVNTSSVSHQKNLPSHKKSPCSAVIESVGTEVKLGSTVASMFWGERPAIKTTTSMDMLVLNYVVYT